ncbi:CYFA0S07e01882g1_1 [Cyberlindnera fabianii]|uniref:CYFA0S07e01882g1_1 n=1 Tax=Cyberlindnera fabianii TaxID=36022 RepID=A0A061B1B2_CYBFA|nr:CYFA0S07e01882g1_1 [Cyberlindnera fabianii]
MVFVASFHTSISSLHVNTMAAHSIKSTHGSLESTTDEKISGTINVAEVSDLEAQPVISTIMSPNGEKIVVDNNPGIAGVDEALAVAEQYEDIEVSPEEDAKLRRKLDFLLLPIFGFLYMVQFMDKTCISFAAIMGIQTDFNMTGQMYPWTSSGFYLGYLCASPFASYTLQKLPPVRTSSGCIVIWGTIQCLCAACKTYPTFMVCRVLLGALEAFVSPIFVIIMNQYFRKSEHFGRMAYFYGFNGLGTLFMSGVSGGLYTHKDSYSIKAYNILFLIIGLMTILVGFVILAVVPNNPSQAKFLSEREIAVVVSRIRGNQQGFGTKKFKKEQVIECISDIRTWIYFLIAMCNAIPNGGVSSFSSIIIKSFGYDTVTALWMKAPSGAFELVFLCALPWVMMFMKSRMLVADLYLAVVLMGLCFLAFGTNKMALVGIWIFGMSPVAIATVSSCIASNTAGHTKKLTANALSLMAWSCGNMIGPQTFRAEDAPHYNPAKGTFVGCFAGAFLLIMLLALLNWRENKKRDDFKKKMGDEYVVVKNQEFADLTDKQNPEFRYAF